MQQLQDCAVKASKRSHKEAISQMFPTEMKFTADCIIL